MLPHRVMLQAER